MMTYISQYLSPLGMMTMATHDGNSLCGLWFDGQRYDRCGIAGTVVEASELPVFLLTADWLDRYYSGEEPEADIPLDFGGSDFRQNVLRLLQQIPYGQTMTYGEIAHKLERQTGRRASAQAVGGAVGHNPISLVIPCHRVVGTDGKLTGYAGGLERKEWLLRMEKKG